MTITIPDKILKENNLTENALLLEFLAYLRQKQQKTKNLPIEPKPLLFGELAHLGTFKMSEDFDAPLEDFNEYM